MLEHSTYYTCPIPPNSIPCVQLILPHSLYPAFQPKPSVPFCEALLCQSIARFPVYSPSGAHPRLLHLYLVQLQLIIGDWLSHHHWPPGPCMFLGGSC